MMSLDTTKFLHFTPYILETLPVAYPHLELLSINRPELNSDAGRLPTIGDVHGFVSRLPRLHTLSMPLSWHGPGNIDSIRSLDNPNVRVELAKRPCHSLRVWNVMDSPTYYPSSDRVTRAARCLRAAFPYLDHVQSYAWCQQRWADINTHLAIDNEEKRFPRFWLKRA